MAQKTAHVEIPHHHLIKNCKLVDLTRDSKYYGKGIDKVLDTARAYPDYLSTGFHEIPDSFVDGKIRQHLGLLPDTIIGRQEFENLLNRTHPIDGSKLPGGIIQQSARTVGWDATVTNPKSVSDMAVFDLRIPREFKKLVKKLIRRLEKKVAYRTRKGHKAMKRMGVESSDLKYQEFSGEMICVVVVEYFSRSGDPALHAHVVIPNITRDKDGAYIAVHYRELLREINRQQKWFSARLREMMIELGYEIRYRDGERWELAHVTDEMIRKTSARQRDILRNQNRLRDEFSELQAIPRNDLSETQFKRLRYLCGGDIYRTEMDEDRLESLAKQMYRPRKKHHTIAQIRDRMVEKLGLDTVRELSKAAVKAGADKIYAHVRDPRIKCACNETPIVTPESETTKMNDLRLIAEDAIAEYREKIAANHKDLPQPDSLPKRQKWEDEHSHSVILERLHTALQKGVTLESTNQLIRPQEFRKVEILQPRYPGPGLKTEEAVAQTVEEETRKAKELEELRRILRRMALDVHFLERNDRMIDYKWRRRMRKLLKIHAAKIHGKNALVGLAALQVYLDHHAEADERLEKFRLNPPKIDFLPSRTLPKPSQGPSL